MAKTIEITEEKLQELLNDTAARAARQATEAAIAGLAARSSTPQAPPMAFEDADPDTQFKAMMDARRGKDRPPKSISKVAAHSEDTGATFLAVIDDATGVVFRLDAYTFPDGVDRHMPDGRVPDGLQIHDKNGQPTIVYKQWRWENFWQADLRRFIGKKLPKYARVEAAAPAAAE